jgi:hypothetical protein
MIPVYCAVQRVGNPERAAAAGDIPVNISLQPEHAGQLHQSTKGWGRKSKIAETHTHTRTNTNTNQCVHLLGSNIWLMLASICQSRLS